ncbi:MAG TPA: GNAT family N-acetyltransferase [Sedimentisphaerales bacterium]|nr:GNAT family N-acetyltransferase [Sedimentisphaerales bacterium]
MADLVGNTRIENVPAERQIRLSVIRKSDFINKNYPAHWQDTAQLLEPGPRFRRMIETNPLCKSDNAPAQIVALHGKKVVGRYNLLNGQLIVKGRRVCVTWLSGLLVCQEYRNRGIGTELVRCAQRSGTIVAGCGLSHLSRPIFQKLGFVEFVMPRYMLLHHSRCVVDKYVPSQTAASVVRPAADALLSVHRRLLSVYSRLRLKGLRVQTVHAISSEFDSKLAGRDVPVVSHRSGQWINWLLGSADPNERRQQRLYQIYDRNDNAVGYFIVRRRFHESASQQGYRNVLLGSLKDWGIFDAAKVDLLGIILLAVRELLAWGVDAVEVCVTDRQTGKALRRLGLVHKGNLHMIYSASDNSALSGDEYKSQANWRITPAEGDNFYN